MKCEVCPYCGCNLDHGEKCTCQEEAQEAERQAKRDGKIEALRAKLMQYAQEQSAAAIRDRRLAILRAQMKAVKNA